MKFFKCKARRDTSRSIKNWNDFHDHDPVLNTRQSSSKHKKEDSEQNMDITWTRRSSSKKEESLNDKNRGGRYKAVSNSLAEKQRKKKNKNIEDPSTF